MTAEQKDFYIDRLIYSKPYTIDFDLHSLTVDEIDSKIKELDHNYNSMQYQRDRKKEYEALNQFELQYDDMLNGTTTWKDAINAIKAKYPKPTS